VHTSVNVHAMKRERENTGDGECRHTLLSSDGLPEARSYYTTYYFHEVLKHLMRFLSLKG
jgi:hypothetical protein